MKTKLIFLLALLLISPAIAKTEDIILGPYNISFDLNTSDKYVIWKSGPEYGENFIGTKYESYELSSDKADVRIAILKFEISTEGDREELTREAETVTSSALSIMGGNPPIVNARSIDGKPGAIATKYVGMDAVYMAVFSPDYDSSKNMGGKYACIIGSSMPWNEGTADLIRTIHIELPEVV